MSGIILVVEGLRNLLLRQAIVTVRQVLCSCTPEAESEFSFAYHGFESQAACSLLRQGIVTVRQVLWSALRKLIRRNYERYIRPHLSPLHSSSLINLPEGGLRTNP